MGEKATKYFLQSKARNRDQETKQRTKTSPLPQILKKITLQNKLTPYEANMTLHTLIFGTRKTENSQTNREEDFYFGPVGCTKELHPNSMSLIEEVKKNYKFEAQDNHGRGICSVNCYYVKERPENCLFHYVWKVRKDFISSGACDITLSKYFFSLF